MNKIIYKRKEYVIYDAKCGYVAHNTRKEFKDGHSHFDSLETAKMVIDWCVNKMVPPNTSRYMIISLIRLTRNYKYKNRLQNALYNK